MTHKPSIRIAVLATGLLAVGSLPALELPPKKVGLWETSSLSSRHPGTAVRVQMCFAAGTDRELNAQAEASLKKMGCSSVPLRYLDGSYVYDSTCKLGPNTMTTHSVISYPADGTIHGLTTMDTTGGGGRSTMTSDSKWIGPCRSDQKPGEGEIMNMDQFRKPRK